MRHVLRLSSLALLSFGVSAGTISEFGGGTNHVLNPYHFGQMITTPAGGPWHNINFCFAGPTSCGEGWGDDPGNLYLLSQEYLGPASDLASAPGLIATSIGTSQHAWIFSSSVVLLPNTTYYFYEDGNWAGNTCCRSGDTIGPFPGYMAQPFPNFTFERTGSTDYRLTGDAVPEPSPLTLLALGLLPLLIARRRIVGT